MTLPNVSTIQVAVKPLPHFAQRQAAAAAGGPPINFMAATLIVGDGNQTIPAISDLMASGHCAHEVWRSATAVHGVTPNPANDKQLDILCVVPAVDAQANEIGPFWITEFVLTDETGTPTIIGTTLAPKLVTANGSPMDLAFVAAVGFSEGAVILTPPSAAFATLLDVEMAINAHQPTALAPLTQSDTIDQQGWLHRAFSARAATDALTGFGRVAASAEIEAGAAAPTADYKNPWVTPAQLKGVKDAIAVASGYGVEVAAQKTNLRIDALDAASALAQSDALAIYQAAAGAAPAKHRKATLAALFEYLRPLFAVNHDGTLTGDGTAQSPLGVGAPVRAWAIWRNNAIASARGISAITRLYSGIYRVDFSAPISGRYGVIGGALHAGNGPYYAGLGAWLSHIYDDQDAADHCSVCCWGLGGDHVPWPSDGSDFAFAIVGGN